VSRREKLLAKIRNNPKSVRYDELAKVLEWHGFDLRRSKGSHRMYVRTPQNHDCLAQATRAS
jgi:predicted RNA binding protein YcfA (HicA-like mRNA interferase family)